MSWAAGKCNGLRAETSLGFIIMTPKAVALVGKPDSGKTTLMEKLLPELNHRGYRVGTIKHHAHEFEMDKKRQGHLAP